MSESSLPVMALCVVVHKLDGGLEHVVNRSFATGADVSKCLKQIKLPNLLLTCAPYSTLPETEVKRYRERERVLYTICRLWLARNLLLY